MREFLSGVADGAGDKRFVWSALPERATEFRSELSAWKVLSAYLQTPHSAAPLSIQSRCNELQRTFFIVRVLP